MKKELEQPGVTLLSDFASPTNVKQKRKQISDLVLQLKIKEEEKKGGGGMLSLKRKK